MNCDLQIKKTIRDSIQTVNSKNNIVIWGKSTCPWCVKAKEYLNKLNKKYAIFYVDLSPYMQVYSEILKETHPTFPQIIRNNKLIGGFSELQNYKF